MTLRHRFSVVPALLVLDLACSRTAPPPPRNAPPPPSAAAPPAPAPINTAPPPAPPAPPAKEPRKIAVVLRAPSYNDAMALVDWLQANVAAGEIRTGTFANETLSLTVPFSGGGPVEFSTRVDKQALGRLGVRVSTVSPDGVTLDLLVLDEHLQHAR